MLEKSAKMQKRMEKLKLKKEKQLQQDLKNREKERAKEEGLRARVAVSDGIEASGVAE